MTALYKGLEALEFQYELLNVCEVQALTALVYELSGSSMLQVSNNKLSTEGANVIHLVRSNIFHVSGELKDEDTVEQEMEARRLRPRFRLLLNKINLISQNIHIDCRKKDIEEFFENGFEISEKSPLSLNNLRRAIFELFDRTYLDYLKGKLDDLDCDAALKYLDSNNSVHLFQEVPNFMTYLSNLKRSILERIENKESRTRVLLGQRYSKETSKHALSPEQQFYKDQIRAYRDCLNDEVYCVNWKRDMDLEKILSSYPRDILPLSKLKKYLDDIFDIAVTAREVIVSYPGTSSKKSEILIPQEMTEKFGYLIKHIINFRYFYDHLLLLSVSNPHEIPNIHEMKAFHFARRTLDMILAAIHKLSPTINDELYKIFWDKLIPCIDSAFTPNQIEKFEEFYPDVSFSEHLIEYIVYARVSTQLALGVEINPRSTMELFEDAAYPDRFFNVFIDTDIDYLKTPKDKHF